jgi:hypothetical protein
MILLKVARVYIKKRLQVKSVAFDANKESDPVFAASPAASITQDDIDNWNAGTGGGPGVETDPTVPQHVKDIQQSDINNWNGKADDDDLDDEITRAEGAEQDLQDNIDAEEAARISADSALGTSLSSEISTRSSADSTLQGNINSEASTRSSADSSLQSQITALSTLIDTSMKKPEAYNPASGNYPTTYAGAPIEAGDTFRITAAGSVGSNTVNGEDLLIALVDTPGQTNSNWQVVESNRDQSSETVKGVAKLSTQAIIEDSATSNDTDIVTPKKWWQGWTKGLTLSAFFSAVIGTVLTGLSTATNAAITASDTILSGMGKLQKQITDLIITVSGKEDGSNKSTNTSLGTSDTLYPSQKAVKTYVDNHSVGSPDVFDFTDQSGVGWNVQLSSNTVTLSGPSTGVWSLMLRGSAGTPQMSINGGSWVTEGLARTGDTVQLRMTSANAGSTGRTANLYINGLSVIDWVLTTVAFSPAIISGCKVWLTADAGITKDGSDNVSAWADQSGVGNNATQATGANQPKWIDNVLNGKPVLRFDGSNDRIRIANSVDYATIFVVAKYSGGATFNQYPGIISPSSSSPSPQYFFIGANGSASFYNGTSSALFQTKIYVNGTNTDSFSPLSSFKVVYGLSNSGSAATRSNVDVGNNANDGSSFWNGDIAEVIAYDSVLGSTDLTNLMNYLNAKYNLP